MYDCITAGELCLLVHLHMYGEHVGQFSAYQRYSDGRRDRTLVYRNNGTTNDWSKMGQIVLSSQHSFVVGALLKDIHSRKSLGIIAKIKHVCCHANISDATNNHQSLVPKVYF